MRTFSIISLGVVGGIALGVGVAGARYGATSNEYVGRVASSPPPGLAAPGPGVPRPAVRVEGTDSFDFGDVDAGVTVEHGFVLKNDGPGALTLRKGGTTCGKCTVNDLPADTLQAGESETVTVTYHAPEHATIFRQSASILTNDPNQPRVSLTVTGNVVAAVSASPSEIVFTRISTTAPATAEVRLLAFSAVPLEVTGHEFLEPETADRFRMELAPLPAEEIKNNAARSGAMLKVTALPGLPTGALRQQLRLTTNQEKSPAIVLPIQGVVDSDVSVIGAGWDRERGALGMGVVHSRQGTRRQVTLLVRGAHRHDAKIKIAAVEPRFVQAELGSPEPIHGGDVIKWPLTVIIPPGAPNMNCTAPPQGTPGMLTLETTIPDVPQVSLSLRFLVEE